MNGERVREIEFRADPDGIIEHFRRNDMSITDLLKEFVDNSVQQMMEDPESDQVDTKIRISGYGADGRLNLEKATITISDNGKGIQRHDLETSLSVWGTQKRNLARQDSLNEHGIGMKVAAWSLGEDIRIITKSKSDPNATVVPRLGSSGKAALSEDKKSFGEGLSGTTIHISRLRPQGLMDRNGKNSAISTMDSAAENISQLGCIYADHLYRWNANSPKRLSITVELEDLNGQVMRSFRVTPQFRHYQGLTSPPAKTFKISEDCEATLTFGVAASDEELEARMVQRYDDAKHPFYKWNRTISIIHKGRTLAFAPLSTFGIPNTHFAQYPIQGELRIVKGFPTKGMKDGLAHSDEWIVLKTSVEKEIRRWASEIQKHSGPVVCNSEKELNRYLADRWRKEKIIVRQEYPVESCGGFIDLLRSHSEDGPFTPAELKMEQADVNDLYQCLKYKDFGPKFMDKKNFWLIAPSFSNNCVNAAPEIERIHGLKIELMTFESLGIGFGSRTKCKRKTKPKTVEENLRGRILAGTSPAAK